jgi:hypothetical protein
MRGAGRRGMMPPESEGARRVGDLSGAAGVGAAGVGAAGVGAAGVGAAGVTINGSARPVKSLRPKNAVAPEGAPG